MNNIPDYNERQQALDTSKSFIVQAPAGSGKTEILIQRYLKLLQTVNSKPEEVIAITFTKKAAAEMRHRVSQALQLANSTPEPDEPHKKITWNLANKVLIKDKEHNWNLISNPNRLKIQTIDSLNAWLSNNLDNPSNISLQPEILENPSELYLEVAYQILADLEKNQPWTNAIATLLLHLDNKYNTVAKLIANMLANRDQWLQFLITHKQKNDLQDHLEQILTNISTSAIAELTDHLSEDQLTKIQSLLSYSYKNLKQDCNSINFSAHSSNINTWSAVSKMLLTTAGTPRARIDKSIGFPAPSSTKDKALSDQFKDYKQQLAFLIDELCQNHDIINALQSIQQLPPTSFSSSQWETLQALFDILPIAVAQLQVLFQQNNHIDFIEQAHLALTALQDIDSHGNQIPTELALALDHEINHILVDEFQDTSLTQIQLLSYLTKGWSAGDSRTLFIVGDPMQSIYRFRKADVNLFIETKNNGIGDIKLTTLQLKSNFRSEQNIVSWVNNTFSQLLPQQDNLKTAAISYKPSQSIIENSTDSTVKQYIFDDIDGEDEANKITEIIKATAQDKTIAILVKARPHLIDIIAVLQYHDIPFHAIEIENLRHEIIIQDLLSLTKALLDLTNRTAWLSILRAPWSALSLTDLTLLAQDDTKTIWEQISNSDVVNLLSEHGKTTIRRILPTLRFAINQRFRMTLSNVVNLTWVYLGGPAAIDKDNELDNAQTFFELLLTIDDTNKHKTAEKIEIKLEKLFSSPKHLDSCRLHIMTIHRSKGLEFDIVILPKLHKQSPPQSAKLVQWLEISHPNNQPEIIFAPIKASDTDSDPIYTYISKQEKIKQDNEDYRLLYVAATRAKQQLHLLAAVNVDDDGVAIKPHPSSFLAKLWDVIDNENLLSSLESEIEIYDGNKQLIRLNANNLKLSHLDDKNPATNNQDQSYELTSSFAKAKGIVTHKLLQNIADNGFEWWANANTDNQSNYITKLLLDNAVSIENTEKLTKEILTIIDHVLADQRGQWILCQHTDSQSELQLSTTENRLIKQFVLDRTFIDESDKRWIIDYKTFDNPELYNSTELQEMFATQLNHYAAIFSKIENRDIHLGIYLPQTLAWVDWKYQNIDDNMLIRN